MEKQNSTTSQKKKMTLQEEIDSWREQGYKPGEMVEQARRNHRMRETKDKKDK